ncbi:choice-of-anchor D domain-containing protein [Dactylosporangium cerinum]|uniref:Choice-of-anchor D domain-containing protein n=1 Tax=Dactylosporangium cerinum TaxID=1434730 RepID=A0ABV9VNY7_9ACTN
MRLHRKFAAVLAAVGLAVIPLPTVAGAATGPTAPYDALTVNGVASVSLSPLNGWVTLRPFIPADKGFFFEAYDDKGEFWTLRVAPAIGQKLAIGTYPTLSLEDATHYGLSVARTGSCSQSSGSITIQELTLDPQTFAVTSIAATYDQQNCLPAHGEIRWHSNRPYTDAVQSPAKLDFGRVVAGHTATKTVSLTSTGSAALQLGAASLVGGGAAQFSVVANACVNKTLAYGQSCDITVKAQPAAVGDQAAELAVADNSAYGKRSIPLSVTGERSAEGTFTSLDPVRLLDTRDGTGAPRAPLGGGQTLHLQVTGRGGVPATSVTAVVLNMTVVNPTSASFLTVFPSGVARPTASNLNFPAKWVGANAVTVPVGTNGQVDIYNPAGNVDVVADVSGYYHGDDVAQSGAPAGTYWTTEPERLVDTRDGTFGGALPRFTYVRVPVSYGPEFDRHITALAVNITAVDPTAGGYLTAWSGANALPPGASTLNFTPHSVVPNFAIVPTRWCDECGGFPTISVANASSGSTHVIVDIFGFYDDGQLDGGLRFHPLTPTRITDTREGLGARTFTGRGTATITAPATVAGDNTAALVSNVTGVNPSNSTYFSLWADGGDQPMVSNLNLTPHEVRSNAAVIPVGPGNKFAAFNAAWTVDLVIDVAGTFEFGPGSAATARSLTTNAGPRNPIRQPAATPSLLFIN